MSTSSCARDGDERLDGVAHGITEIWFDDVDGFAAVFTSPEYLATVRPDEESFLDLASGDTSLTTEHAVFG